MPRSLATPSGGRAGSLGLIAAGLLFATGIVLVASQGLLRAEAEATAADWVQSVRAHAPDFDALLAGEKPSRQTGSLLAAALKVGDVVGFRILNAEGDLLLASDALEAAGPERVMRLRLRYGTGGTGAAPASSATSPAPADVRRASVPVFGKGGKLRGTIEADVDVSGARALHLRWLGATLAGFLLLALLGFAVAAALSGRRRHAPAAEAPPAPLPDRDPSTALATRAPLLKTLARELDLHAVAGRQLAVHHVDIHPSRESDGLMRSEAAERALHEAAARLSGLAERPEHVARIGRGEFLLVQPRAGAEQAAIRAARILNALASVQDAAGRDIASSVGVAVAPEHGGDAEALLVSADAARAEARRAGGSAVRVFDPEALTSNEKRIALGHDLKRAFGDGRFELHYQPQYDLASRRLTGFEAVLRLDLPDRGEMSPAEFIPVAEETGLIVPLGEWAMREACRAASHWPERLTLAVDLSPGQIHGSDAAESLRAILDAAGLPARRLAVEIPDKALPDAPAAVAEQFERLRGMGVAIVVDGFGTGASGLGHLRRFSPDAVKIDRSLVHALGAEKGAESLLRAVVAVGQAFGVRVMAEGVESVEEAHVLVSNACRRVQGDLFGPPVPLSDVAAIIAKDARNAAVSGEATATGQGGAPQRIAAAA